MQVLQNFEGCCGWSREREFRLLHATEEKWGEQELLDEEDSRAKAAEAGCRNNLRGQAEAGASAEMMMLMDAVQLPPQPQTLTRVYKIRLGRTYVVDEGSSKALLAYHTPRSRHHFRKVGLFLHFYDVKVGPHSFLAPSNPTPTLYYIVNTAPGGACFANLAAGLFIPSPLTFRPAVAFFLPLPCLARRSRCGPFVTQQRLLLCAYRAGEKVARRGK